MPCGVWYHGVMKPMEDGVLGDVMWDWEKEQVRQLEDKIQGLQDQLDELKWKRLLWYRKIQMRVRRG